MPKGPIPASLHYVLESTAFAFVSPSGESKENQVNPVRFFWTGMRIQIGLMPGMQKQVNRARDQRIAFTIAHPGNPYRYLEVRGHSGPLEYDVDDAIFNAISTKYAGGPMVLKAEGTARIGVTIIVDKYTFQDSDGIPSPT